MTSHLEVKKHDARITYIEPLSTRSAKFLGIEIKVSINEGIVWGPKRSERHKL